MSTMHASPELYWLPAKPSDWRKRLIALPSISKSSEAAWIEASALARYRLDFSAVNALDAIAQRTEMGESNVPAVRVALLSSCTSTHLHGAIRVGGLRHGLSFEIFEPDYGQYRQALADPLSPLYDFAPQVIVFSFDAATVAAHVHGAQTRQDAKRAAEDYISSLKALWQSAREKTGASIIQQTILPRFPAIAGSNEHRLPSSPAAFITLVNARLREACEEVGIDLLALDTRVGQDGLDRWFSLSSWYSAKQEIGLPAVPMYGDMVARIISARKGLKAKCCVFDLDNTLWGGVIGDDGVQGIIIGPGTAAGEAFLSLHHYGLQLRRRGILLAVCSKNDEANAVEPFKSHPDMGLRYNDIACFVANWDDKASNIRRIAKTLSIGLDSLVFVDDNPFERELVRQTLPEVFVPEIPEDPALFSRCLADSGCFEMATYTLEDAARADLYASNALRDTLKDEATDLESYLTSLGMTLLWSRLRDADVPRVTQLVNKTNQFNLLTRRLSETEVRAFNEDPGSVGLQLRLLDRFGDNGVIAVVTGHVRDDLTFSIDDWLMSCRVLGRQVESATLNVVVAVAKKLGAVRLEGRYRPTKRNSMVADLLPRLGFVMQPVVADVTIGTLDLDTFTERLTPIRLMEINNA